MVGLALVTLSTVVQGVHCLTVKTMFCFNLSSPNEDEYCSLGWLLRIQRMNTAVWVGYNSSLRMLDLGLSLIFDVRTCFCKNKYRTSSSSPGVGIDTTVGRANPSVSDVEVRQMWSVLVPSGGNWLLGQLASS